MRAQLGRSPFAVIDVETTGFNAGGADRVVEVAIVRMRPDCTVEDEFVTLINPERDVGPTDVHGITATDVLHSPPFRDAAGDIAGRLQGSILAGHNLRFDTTFLSAEFGRLGSALPPWPSICTLALAYQLLDEPPSRKLGYCCQEAGIPHDQAHHAVGDARATARLLAHYLGCAASAGMTALQDLGCTCLELPEQNWAPWPCTGRHVDRSQAAHRAKTDRQYLARLVERLPGDDASDANQAEYMTLLDRALQDRRVTEQEAKSLFQMAQTLGMSGADVRAVHDQYLKSLVEEVRADGVVSPTERKDLDSVAEMLGVSEQRLGQLLSEPMEAVQPVTSVAEGSLKGKSVCFTGEMEGMVGGEEITRELAERLAAAAGLIVHPRVTRKLDVLVVADPNTSSSKAVKAREYGTTVMAAAAFWKAIGLQVG